jgi:riboflavin synthase alpha subunit
VLEIVQKTDKESDIKKRKKERKTNLERAIERLDPILAIRNSK